MSFLFVTLNQNYAFSFDAHTVIGYWHMFHIWVSWSWKYYEVL